MLASLPQPITLRHEWRDGDAEAIVELHRRVYCAEYERNDRFVAGVAGTLAQATALGWPQAQGAVWLADQGDRVVGSLGLTAEAEGVGQVRWFVLEAPLRGQGMGRAWLTELLAAARTAGMRKLQLDTFSALRAAAHLYRDAGFRVVAAEDREDWGPPITYQRYELSLM